MNLPRLPLRRLLPGFVRWTAPGLATLLVPKCLCCVAGYAALATSLGFGGSELCGARFVHPSAHLPRLLAIWALASLALFAARRAGLGRWLAQRLRSLVLGKKRTPSSVAV